MLKQEIESGWKDKTQTPETIRKYFQYKDELTIQDDIIFRGDRLVVPHKMKKDILKELH